jgi:hypothetical protein
MIVDEQKGGDETMNQMISAKELSYINDSLKNEDLIAKLSFQGSVEAQNPQLKPLLGQIAQDRMQSFEQLLRTLQQQAHITQ